MWESGSIWQKVSGGKVGRGWGPGGVRVKCIVWMYVLMFGMCTDPTESCIGMKASTIAKESQWHFQFFSLHHPFCLRMTWRLSLLVTSKQPWIIDFIATLQHCPPTHRATVETASDEASAQMHKAHACSHTNKHTPNYQHHFATVKLNWSENFLKKQTNRFPKLSIRRVKMCHCVQKK